MRTKEVVGISFPIALIDKIMLIEDMRTAVISLQEY